MRRLTTLILIPALAVFAIACNGGDDEPDETPTDVPTMVAPDETASPEATATTEPDATDTPEATETPEGTPFPGTTDPVPFDSVPAQPQGIYTLTDVRVGEHPEAGGYDRIVFEFEGMNGEDGAHPAGTVEYVEDPSQCGSGNPVEVEGDAILAVRFESTQAHNEQGELTIDDTEIDGPGNSILEAVSYCDFEGLVQWAMGLPSELEYNVTFLADPGRVVIDVQWP